MAKERGLEFKVGLLIVIAAAVLIAFVFVLGNFSLGKGYDLYVDYTFSGNLQEGAPVKVSGIKVGKVKEIAFWGGKMDPKLNRRVQVRVRVWVQDRVRETIREDAEFFVNTSGVLGEQYLEIAPGSYEKPPLPPGSVVRGVDPPRTDLIVARLYEFLDSVTGLLHDDKDLIRNLLKNGASAIAELNTLLVENRQELGKLIRSTDRLADEGATTLHDLRTGLGDPRVIGRTVNDLDATLVSSNKALTELTPKAGKLLDEGTRVAGVITEQRVDRALAAVDSADGLMGKAGHLVDNVDGMVTDLRAGKGTAGALLVREEVYADVKEMVRDLKRNPWKFLWKE
jgi:phospholipid/cholesterol/gamma-HCH transport system substrate-binding protein